MNPEGFEPPTFGSGIRRAAVAPWVRGVRLSDAALVVFQKRFQTKKVIATTWDRTKDLSVNSRPLCQRSSGGFPDRELNPGLAGESRLS